jgi:hypothetical protein
MSKRTPAIAELAMLLKPEPFKVGQRVRPSPYALERFVFPKTRHNQSGVVTRVDEFGSPTVLWDGFKTPKGYFAGFITRDRRRR